MAAETDRQVSKFDKEMFKDQQERSIVKDFMKNISSDSNSYLKEGSGKNAIVSQCERRVRNRSYFLANKAMKKKK